MDEMKKLFDDFVAEADKLIEKYKKKEKVRTKKIKHEIPGKTIYWGEEAPEEMDWYDAKEWCKEQGGRLPTRVELLQAYEDGVDGFSSDFYWSSSESSSDYAWRQYFGSGYQSDNDKYYPYSVRCVFDNN